MHRHHHDGTQPEVGYETLGFDELQEKYPGRVLRYGELTPSVHPSARLMPGAVITGDVRLAAETSLWCNLAARGDINYISVGERSNVQDGAVLHVADPWPCVIREDVTVGHQAIVHGALVESGALVGMGSIVLNGARVGRGALIAAGAVVTEETEVPPRTLWAGTPAEKIRDLPEDEDFAEVAEKYTQVKAHYEDSGPDREPHD